ncbi:MAG: ATP synthase F1 subunit delta [Gemmatimonadales bacterium]
MSTLAVARNYAEALFALAEKEGKGAEYAALIDAVAGAIELAPRVEAVLLSPRVTKGEKSKLLADALPKAPKGFVLFLQAVVKRGRQGLFRQIATEYLTLLDVKLNRVRARVTLARVADAAQQKEIVAALTKALDKTVLASFGTDAALLGGAVVQVGDRRYDGSVRRKMVTLRRVLLAK